IGGLFLGPISAIILALLVTFLSNILLGMGIWTIWQIISWSIIGILSGFMGKFRGHTPLYVVVIFSIFCGYLYGFIIFLTTYQVLGHFLPYYLLFLSFDKNHVFVNVVFLILLNIIYLLHLNYIVNNIYYIYH